MGEGAGAGAGAPREVGGPEGVGAEAAGGVGPGVGGVVLGEMHDARSRSMNSRTRSCAFIGLVLHSAGKVSVSDDASFTWNAL